MNVSLRQVKHPLYTCDLLSRAMSLFSQDRKRERELILKTMISCFNLAVALPFDLNSDTCQSLLSFMPGSKLYYGWDGLVQTTIHVVDHEFPRGQR